MNPFMIGKRKPTFAVGKSGFFCSDQLFRRDSLFQVKLDRIPGMGKLCLI